MNEALRMWHTQNILFSLYSLQRMIASLCDLS